MQEQRPHHAMAIQRRTRGASIAFISLVLLAAPSAAQIVSSFEEAVERCKSLSDKTEYDACTKKVLSETWNLSVHTDKLDGSKRIAIGIMSPDGVAKIGGKDGWPILFVRCSANKTDLSVVWPTFLGLQPVSVKWRLDNEPIVLERWAVSTEGTTAFANNPVSLSKKMIGKSELVANIESYKGVSATVSFKLNGFGDALKPIREACNWQSVLADIIEPRFLCPLYPLSLDDCT